jgi:hypothetical protein
VRVEQPQVGGWCQAQAVAADGVDALQMPQQLRRRPAPRRRAQIFQRGELDVIGGDQRRELLPLLVRQGAGQAAPEPQGRAMAHAADQALERGDAGQQYLVRQQPGGRPVEQQSRAVIPGPAQHVEPTGQPAASRRVLLQVPEPVAFADHRGMAPALSAVAIGVQARPRHLAELTRHGRNHRNRRLGGIVEKGAEEPRCPELDCEPDPVVHTTHLPDPPAIGGVEVEVAGELLLAGVAGVAAVSRTLLVGQKAARHGVRNSGHLQGSGRGPWINDLPDAKLLCGIAHLCDKFRTGAGARA